jgi:hypothetical protein
MRYLPLRRYWSCSYLSCASCRRVIRGMDYLICISGPGPFGFGIWGKHRPASCGCTRGSVGAVALSRDGCIVDFTWPSPAIRQSSTWPFGSGSGSLCGCHLLPSNFAWRLTAGWFWICALGAIFEFSGNLSKWEDALLLALNGTLAEFGCTPSNPRIFSFCVKLLWLFAFADSLARFSFRRLPSSLFWLPHMCHYRTLC